MWTAKSSHCCCCHEMSDEIVHTVSDPCCKMTCVGSVRQLTVGVCSSACDGGTNPLYLMKTNDLAVLKLSIEKVVSNNQTLDSNSCLLYVFSVTFTSRGTFYETMELCEALLLFWMQVKGKESVYLCRVDCKEVIYIHCFDSFVKHNSLCPLSASPNTKGIQPSQTWHARLQMDDPPHESI